MLKPTTVYKFNIKNQFRLMKLMRKHKAEQNILFFMLCLF